jgi:hypothetical protein
MGLVNLLMRRRRKLAIWLRSREEPLLSKGSYCSHPGMAFLTLRVGLERLMKARHCHSRWTSREAVTVARLESNDNV